MKSRSKILSTLLAAVILFSIGVPTLAHADYWAYVNTGTCPTTWTIYPGCPPTYCYCAPSPCCCRPPCPPKAPPTPEEICLDNKLNRIRDLSLDVLEDLKANVKDYGWKVVKATRDRWKSARYVLKVTVKEICGNASLTFYQVVKTSDYCNYEVFYVWSYDRSSNDYCPDQIIGEMCNLLNQLTN